MKYNISKSTPPGMQNLGWGKKYMLFLLSKVSKDMHQSIVPILFSLLESHASGAEFMRSNQKRKETHPVPQHAQDGDDRPHMRRLPQNRQVVHLTRGIAHSTSPRRTARKPGLPNNMWNRMESYRNVRNRMIAACTCRTFVVWLESALEITFPVREKYFPNWRKQKRIKN